MLDSLIENLLHSPHKYSFYQAIYLLSLVNSDSREIGSTRMKPEDEIVRLRNDCSLMFPHSQISSLKNDDSHEKDRYILETTFTGLYGRMSVLPTLYTASLISSQEEDEEEINRLRAF
jgi:predicted component of type VI protein secretion system